MNELDKIKVISSEKLRKLLKNKNNIVLIDTLTNRRYQQVHLPAANNVCVFEVTFLKRVAELVAHKEQPVVLYGDSNQTCEAITAAGKLIRAGYQDVSTLDGGLSAWQSAGYPLEVNPGAPVEDNLLQPKAGSYRVDPEASTIEWVGRNLNSTHWGTLNLASGEIRVTAEQVIGSFEIDMNSIENVNLAGSKLKPVLEDHLKSDDFFFVNRFPTARFEMTATKIAEAGPVSTPNFAVTGTLSLCGIRAEQNFVATVGSADEGRISAEAHFDFDRTRWGVIYGSSRFFNHLGMHLVFDLISLQLRIVSIPEK